MTAQELRKAERDYRLADEKAAAKREQRNAVIRQALSEGWTHAKIAEATGLTRGRIHQIKEQA